MADNKQTEAPTLGFFGQVRVLHLGEQQVTRKSGRTTFWRRNTVLVDGDRPFQMMEFSDQQFGKTELVGKVARVELSQVDGTRKEFAGRIITVL
jgi:hypothetical protein